MADPGLILVWVVRYKATVKKLNNKIEYLKSLFKGFLESESRWCDRTRVVTLGFAPCPNFLIHGLQV